MSTWYRSGSRHGLYWEIRDVYSKTSFQTKKGMIAASSTDGEKEYFFLWLPKRRQSVPTTTTCTAAMLVSPTEASTWNLNTSMQWNSILKFKKISGDPNVRLWWQSKYSWASECPCTQLFYSFPCILHWQFFEYCSPLGLNITSKFSLSQRPGWRSW